MEVNDNMAATYISSDYLLSAMIAYISTRWLRQHTLLILTLIAYIISSDWLDQYLIHHINTMSD